MAGSVSPDCHAVGIFAARAYAASLRGPLGSNVIQQYCVSRRLEMKKASTPKADQDIPEYTCEQLGVGVRGKYAARYAKATNIVVIDPALTKAFPNSEAVNEALRGLLALTEQTARLTSRPKRAPRKRAAV